MTPKERFLNALQQKPVDRPPVAAVVTGLTVGMMEEVGIYWPEAHHDPQQLADLAASIWEVSGVECIKLPFGMTVEVEVLGCPIDFGTRDTLPTDTSPILNHPEQLVIPDDFLERGRIPVVLQAISRLRERYGDEVPIVTSVVGPFTQAAKLFGFDNLFPWLITNPEYVHQIMEQLTAEVIDVCKAYIEAGSDTIVLGSATCTGDLISPDTYRDFIMAHHKAICNAVSAPVILHICGRSTSHLPHIAETGAAGYSFDEGLDIEEAVKHLKGKVALIGYLPTVEVLLQGSAELSYQASLECLRKGVDILAPGCSMPQHSPMENIAAMVRAAHDWPALAETGQTDMADVIDGVRRSPRGGDSEDGQKSGRRSRSERRERQPRQR